MSGCSTKSSRGPWTDTVSPMKHGFFLQPVSLGYCHHDKKLTHALSSSFAPEVMLSWDLSHGFHQAVKNLGSEVNNGTYL